MATINRPCIFTLSAIMALSSVAGDASGAKSKNNNDGYIWRTELVPCDGKGAAESLSTTKLAELFLGRGIDIAFGALRKAITKAGTDDSKTFEVSNATYLMDISKKTDGNPKPRNVAKRRECVIIGYGTASVGGLGESASILNSGISTPQRLALVPYFKTLGLDNARFFAQVEFEQSSDNVAVKPKLTRLYYPQYLYPGRKNAGRKLLITIEVGEPGVADKMLFAGTLTLENITTSEKMITNTAALATQSKIGWSLNPEIEVNLDSDITVPNAVFPVNLTSTVTETAAGSKFFKKLDEFLDDATTKAIKDEIDSNLLPGKINEGKQQRQQAYRDAIIDFYAKSGALSAACAALKAAPDSQTTISQAWAAFFSAESAYLKLQKAAVPNVLQEELNVQKPKQCGL